MNELLLLIAATAAWCGQPGQNIDDKSIFNCREAVMICSLKAGTNKQAVAQCFANAVVLKVKK